MKIIAISFIFFLNFIVLIQDLRLQNIEKNILEISSQPLGANVYIDSILVGKTPIRLNNYNPGSYKIVLKLNNTSKKELLFNYVGGDQKLFYVLDGNYGLVNFETNPTNSAVFINDSLYGYSPLKNIKLESKHYEIKIKKKDYHQLSFSLYVGQRKYNINRKLENIYGYLSFDSNGKELELWIDSNEVKENNFIEKRLLTGTHHFEIYAKDFHKRFSNRLNIRPDTKNNLLVKYNYFTHKYILNSALLPGLGQFLDNSKTKGILYFLGFLTSAGLLIKTGIDYNKQKDTFNTNQVNYINAKNEDEAIFYRNELEKSLDEVNKTTRLKNTFLGILVGIYVVNLIDASIFHSKGSSIELYTLPTEDMRGKLNYNLGVKFRIN